MNVVKTILPGNNLLMHIRENTDFPRQKPLQLLSAEATLAIQISLLWQQNVDINQFFLYLCRQNIICVCNFFLLTLD